MTLTTLIISADPAIDTEKIVKHVLPFSDQVVVVYSPYKKEEEIKLKKWHVDKKVDLFFAPPLGIAEMYRAYGISKSKCDWIFLIDADETLSSPITKDLLKDLENREVNGVLIKRWEDREKRFFTWQMRLFRRDSARPLGLIHEHMKINGSVSKITDLLCLYHNQKKRFGPPEYVYLQRYMPGNTLFFLIRSYYVTLQLYGPSIKKFISATNEVLEPRKEIDPNLDYKDIRKHVANEGLIGYLGITNEKGVEKVKKMSKSTGLKGIPLLDAMIKARYIRKIQTGNKIWRMNEEIKDSSSKYNKTP